MEAVVVADTVMRETNGDNWAHILSPSHQQGALCAFVASRPSRPSAIRQFCILPLAIVGERAKDGSRLIPVRCKYDTTCRRAESTVLHTDSPKKLKDVRSVLQELWDHKHSPFYSAVQKYSLVYGCEMRVVRESPLFKTKGDAETGLLRMMAPVPYDCLAQEAFVKLLRSKDELRAHFDAMSGGRSD